MTGHQIATWFDEYRYAVIAVSVAVVTSLLARTAARPAALRDGWRQLSPGLGLYAISLFGVLLGVMFTIVSIVIPIAILQGGWDRTMWFLLPISPVMAFIGWYTGLYLFFHRVRFNDSGIESRWLGKTTFLDWKDIAAFKRHWFFGPQLRAKDGRRVTVWEYLRGFNELTAMAAAHGIPVDVSRT